MAHRTTQQQCCQVIQKGFHHQTHFHPNFISSSGFTLFIIIINIITTCFSPTIVHYKFTLQSLKPPKILTFSTSSPLCNSSLSALSHSVFLFLLCFIGLPLLLTNDYTKAGPQILQVPCFSAFPYLCQPFFVPCECPKLTLCSTLICHKSPASKGSTLTPTCHFPCQIVPPYSPIQSPTPCPTFSSLKLWFSNRTETRKIKWLLRTITT